MASVFLVEDDHQIRELAVRALADAGHVVRTEASAMPALRAIIDSAPDVVVLDLGLRDVDGSDLLRMIRAVSDVPVIIATARDEEAEIVRLLDSGADEYVVKPYSGPELEARLRALLRRSESAGHGYPLRGVTGHIPGRRDLQDVYLYKGAKWLRGVKFATSDEPGTWERTGYHNDGDIWREERSGIRIGK